MPFGNSYSYRRTVTVDNANVGADLAGFPVLIAGTYSYLAHTDHGGKVTSESGFDIVFAADEDGATPLWWEIESYNHETGALVFKVKVDLDTDADTVFYLFYGMPEVSTFQSDAEQVWSAHAGVWHFPDGSTLGALDSTTNDNDGTISNIGADAGQVYGAASCSGDTTDRYIRAAYSASLKFGTGNFSVSAWVKTSDANDGAQKEHVFVGANRFGVGEAWLLEIGDGSDGNKAKFVFATFGTGSSGYVVSTATINDGAWHRLVAVRSGTSILLYVDGAAAGSGSVDSGYNSDGAGDYLYFLNLASAPTGGWCPVALLDEVQIIGDDLSAEWVAAEFANHDSPATFYAFGDETLPTTSYEESLSLGCSVAHSLGTRLAIQAATALGIEVRQGSGMGLAEILALAAQLETAASAGLAGNAALNLGLTGDLSADLAVIIDRWKTLFGSAPAGGAKQLFGAAPSGARRIFKPYPED